MVQICLSLLATVDMFDDQLVIFAENEGADLSDITVPNDDTLAGSDEYHRMEHKRRDPDHVFLRLSCSPVLSIYNIHTYIFLLGLEEDKTCLQTI
jgi:hypothetical protein